ncbi:transcriptional regulator [Nocardia sp. NPDC050435]|uniref:transcriptional regulator n=1 Tax=Nocardia sp. NPDC050435 TaxID=3155040 RepID=UPI0033F44FCD
MGADQAAIFAAVAITWLVAHQAGDYWVQSDHQAAHKGGPGWAGRRACAAHVATYTATQAGALALVAWVLGLALDPLQVAAGLAISAGTHYIADRRTPLRRLAGWAGHGGFYARGTGLASGAAYLDQSWHWVWIGVGALVAAA